jgi:hypothetical protein
VISHIFEAHSGTAGNDWIGWGIHSTRAWFGPLHQAAGSASAERFLP